MFKIFCTFYYCRVFVIYLHVYIETLILGQLLFSQILNPTTSQSV